MNLPASQLLAVAGLGACILLCVLGGAAQRLPDGIGAMSRNRMAGYVAWAATAGIPYAAAVAVVTWRSAGTGRGCPAAVLVLGAAMRLVTFLPPPMLPTDVCW